MIYSRPYIAMFLFKYVNYAELFTLIIEFHFITLFSQVESANIIHEVDRNTTDMWED